MRGEATRQVILTAAETVFAERGFAGARVDTIAATSGFDKKLIFRYFGDKLGLYAAVLRRADQDLRDLQMRLLMPILPYGTPASFTIAIGAIFDYLVAHPRFLRILTWEMADGWQTAAQILSERDRQDVEQLRPLLSQPLALEWLRSTFSPVIQLSMVLQVCQSYLSFLPLYQLLLPEQEVSSTAALAHAREYLIGLLTHGMTVGGTQDGTASEVPQQAEHPTGVTASNAASEMKRSRRKQV
jgi:TetR/AcrR family transcriptional regulator